MPTRTVTKEDLDPVDAAVDKVSTNGDIEHLADGFDGGLAWKKVKFRGVTYKLVELEISDHNKIEDLSKEKVNDADGNETDVINSRTQNRLMMEKSIVEPKGVSISKMGTRLYGNLLQVMRELHYFPEVDEFRKKPETDGETPKGN